MPGGQENYVSFTFTSWLLMPCCEKMEAQIPLSEWGLKSSKSQAAVEYAKQRVETELGAEVRVA